MFTLNWVPVSAGYMSKLSDDDHGGGGAFVSFGAFIYKEGKEYISAPMGYVEQTSEYNTVLQNRRIEQSYKDSEMFIVVGDQTKVKDFPIPPKAKFMLDALIAAEEKGLHE